MGLCCIFPLPLPLRLGGKVSGKMPCEKGSITMLTGLYREHRRLVAASIAAFEAGDELAGQEFGITADAVMSLIVFLE